MFGELAEDLDRDNELFLRHAFQMAGGDVFANPDGRRRDNLVARASDGPSEGTCSVNKRQTRVCIASPNTRPSVPHRPSATVEATSIATAGACHSIPEVIGEDAEKFRCMFPPARVFRLWPA